MDSATSTFPKMGEEPLTHSLVNVSGDRSPYTIPQPRDAGGVQGDVLATGGTAHRSQILMSGEHNGPTFRPVTKIAYPNSPEASQTGRGMRLLPPAGHDPFWEGRSENTGGKVIG